MTEITTYRCEQQGCDKIHSGNNGWFLLQRRGRFIVVGQWQEQLDLSEYEHFCSVNCLFQRISALTGREL